jgi:hypothetical protein
MQKKMVAFVLIVAFVLVLRLATGAQQTDGDGPQFVNSTNLVRPAKYREWVFLGSTLGLTYLPSTAALQSGPPFGNVFVNPTSYRSFMQTGKWPNATMFVVEARRSSTEGAVVQGGRYQTDLFALEAEVKDSRFPDGWAFFSWGPVRALSEVAAPAPPDAANPGEETCVECHTKRTAVERTFVQFYPTLLEVARQKGTLKPGF